MSIKKAEQLEILKKDAEELARLNEKLLQSERLKSEFLSNIRNEINNPLTSILGLSQILKRPENLSSNEISELSGLIYKEAFYLNLQMATIFAAADLEAGEAVPEPGNVQVLDLISEIMDDFKEMASEKNISILFENQLENDACEIVTDRKKLKLILSCLISNGLNYNKENGEVKISLHQNKDELTITVQDKGIGIDSSQQQRVFDRFVQLDYGVEKRYRGLGLGLSVAKELIKLLGGEIILWSKLGQGSTFEIKLPANNFGENLKPIFGEEVLWDSDDGSFDKSF